ncbi:MAG TPA: hypothetical protein VFT56_14020 [Sphingomonas sp.]|nr:hypothetical protein [Sphingomonas sp.]
MPNSLSKGSESPDRSITGRCRADPALRAKLRTVSRTADHLGIEMPAGKMTCGEAHDWLAAHGANVRLRRKDEDVGANQNSSAAKTDDDRAKDTLRGDDPQLRDSCAATERLPRDTDQPSFGEKRNDDDASDAAPGDWS